MNRIQSMGAGFDFPNLAEKIINRKNLSADEAHALAKEILSGNLLQVQIASILTALRCKGETIDEIVGFVKAMRESMTKIYSSHSVIVDTCGTGGDRKGTFNISTAAAFVVAGAGLAFAKHGNRSVSSHCGSADVLEAAGVKIDMPKETAEKCLNEINITFLFAPLYHPAMKNVAPVRKELGIRTVFNILGPLVNPAGANVQVIGVAKKEFVPLIAKVLMKLGNKGKYSSLVIHESGYDELVLQGRADVSEVGNNKVRKFSLSPKDFGMKKVKSEVLQGGDAKENARILREIFSGKGHPLEDVVVANSAMGIACSESAGTKNKALSLKESVKRSQESILSGNALKKLDQLIEWSNKPLGNPDSLKK